MNRLIKLGIEMALKVEPLEDKELEDWRMDQCRGCDRYDAENDKCKECGCFMEIKTGLKYNHNPKKWGRVEVTHCPLGRWNDLEIANSYRKVDGLEPLEAE